jgi:hypothetical protein
MAERSDGLPLPEGIDDRRIFVVHPENDPYVRGEAPLPATWRLWHVNPRFSFLLLLGYWILLFGLMRILENYLEKIPDAVSTLALFSFYAALGFWAFVTLYEERRINKEGIRRVLAATVIASKACVWPKDKGWQKLTYEFESPSGVRIRRSEDKPRRQRGDGSYDPLPSDDAVLLVLYLDDRHFRLL